MGFAGELIRRERLEKGWSQQGLCAGICAVSYLSKIEQGRAEPSDEVLKLLLARLGVTWHTGETAQRARALADALFDAVCSFDSGREAELLTQLDAARERYFHTDAMLELLLLESICRQQPPRGAEAFADNMDDRRRALWHWANRRPEEAARLLPVAATRALAGYADYAAGRYALAQERLSAAFIQAAEECRVHVMVFCKLIQGNCYSDLNQFDDTLRCYQGAQRLALAVDDQDSLRDIRYNIASTQLQFRRYEEAYAYFSALAEPRALDLHKLAICCEGLGRREEALAALDRAAEQSPGYLPKRLIDQMCGVVRFRLEHPDYLRSPAYGDALTRCFNSLRRELPAGYAAFHRPWMEEWYVANRQYKLAWELSRNFPEKRPLPAIEDEKMP